MHENDRLYLSVQYDNSKHPEQEAFNLAEFIIYAMHPETQTETDVAYATLGDYQQPVPAYSADLPASIFSFPMVLVVSDEIELGGRMAITPRIAVPAIPDEITMTHTGRVGLQMTATVTLPLPEIP